MADRTEAVKFRLGNSKDNGGASIAILAYVRSVLSIYQDGDEMPTAKVLVISPVILWEGD